MKDHNISRDSTLLKFIFSKKATKIDEIFSVDLTVTTYCQNYGDDFFQFLWPSQKTQTLPFIFYFHLKMYS